MKKLFGERVRELRRERGLSQEGFADECGIHRTYMSGIERGLRNVSIEKVVTIARALDVPVGALFDWNERGTAHRDRRPRSARSAGSRP